MLFGGLFHWSRAGLHVSTGEIRATTLAGWYDLYLSGAVMSVKLVLMTGVWIAFAMSVHQRRAKQSLSMPALLVRFVSSCFPSPGACNPVAVLGS